MEILTFIWESICSLLSYFASFFIPAGPKPTIAVIGAGFSGMVAAIQAKKQLGVKAQVFEASGDIGGTWEANTYPGCQCDIPSHLYSFSFELNPNWSHSYSPQPEILSYMRGVAKKYGLYDQTMLSTEVIRTTWMEGQNKWKLEYRHKTSPEDVKTAFFDIVFAGLGPLRIPNVPERYKGFTGEIVHTAFWDHTVDFRNKKVAVIGSGASAVQALPEIQKVATKIVNYQRSPIWVVKSLQLEYSNFQKKLFTLCPPLLRLYRWFIFFLQELRFPIIFRDTNSFLSRTVVKLLTKQMISRLEKHGRGDLADILIPKYPLGCKRIARSGNYLEALAQKNVFIKTGSIKELKGQSIFHEDGTEEQFDILVLATGFDVQGFLGNLEIIGRNKVNLNKLWMEKYPITLQNVNVPNLPNFFFLLGPNSALGHNSVVLITEIQVDYAMRSIRYMMQNNLAAMEAKKEPAERYAAEILGQLKNTPWVGPCNSFYKNDRGEPYTLWSGTVTYFWYRMRHAKYAQEFIHYARS